MSTLWKDYGELKIWPEASPFIMCLACLLLFWAFLTYELVNAAPWCCLHVSPPFPHLLLFSQPTPIWFLPCHFTSDLKMLPNLRDDFQFLSYLVLPLSLQCIPFLGFSLFASRPAYPAAPFWLLFDFLFFQCPLNDNQSLSLSLSSIWSLSFSHSACALSYYICISKTLITIFIQWIHKYSTRVFPLNPRLI